MSLWNSVKGAFRRATVAFSIVPNYFANVRWLISSQYLNLVKEGYKKNSVVYSCVRLLSQSVPEAPLKFYRQNDGMETEAPEHEFRELIRHPNALQTEYEFWELTVIQLSMVGQSYWWKQRGKSGRVIALWPLRPDRVTPIYTNQLPPLQAWYYNLEGTLYELPADDVLNFNYPDPDDVTGGIVEGFGPAQALRRDADIDNQATRFAFALLNNYAMPGTVLTTKAKLDQKQADELKERFARKYGQMHIGEPAVIDGDTTIQQLSFNLRDLQFSGLRDNDEARICAGFGVPAVLVGVKVGLEKAHFSNQREAREFFAETTLSILWTRLADRINADPDFSEPNLQARFDTSNVRSLQGQHNEHATRYYDGLKLGAVTINEYRTKGLRLPSLPDCDVRVMPTTFMEVGDGGLPVLPVVDEPVKPNGAAKPN